MSFVKHSDACIGASLRRRAIERFSLGMKFERVGRMAEKSYGLGEGPCSILTIQEKEKDVK